MPRALKITRVEAQFTFEDGRVVNTSLERGGTINRWGVASLVHIGSTIGPTEALRDGVTDENEVEL